MQTIAGYFQMTHASEMKRFCRPSIAGNTCLHVWEGIWRIFPVRVVASAWNSTRVTAQMRLVTGKICQTSGVKLMGPGPNHFSLKSSFQWHWLKLRWGNVTNAFHPSRNPANLRLGERRRLAKAPRALRTPSATLPSSWHALNLVINSSL